ncbi:oligosaccharide flippase family protein [Sansalvadorimonas sp. 2012CJ34-2]|uniref:Oligosaccharide flippase family protein n=1 Tax=Parendozoicomonas callyspongiae TaxID=2942213 RepID=A0ABT0PKZ3_9GAMM|nr:oligosaccharide flippase family protein [Sansalvadorimonas sp. 2012CJ34-2]MCL6272039.1 oligosaccharide flippase family protein [Sansalvadorimonas sp. 2012CJ34-2]
MQITKRYFLYLLFYTIATLLSFTKFGFLAKALSVEGFGQYSLVMILYVYIIYVGGFGSGEYVLKLTSQKYHNNQCCNNNFEIAVIYGVLGVSCVGIFCILIGWLFFDEYLDIIMLVALLSCCAIFYNIIEAYNRGKQAVLVFSSMLLTKSMMVLLLMYFMVDEYQLLGAFLSECLSFVLVAAAYSVPYFRRRNSKFGGLVKQELQQIIKHGFHVNLSNAIKNFSTSLDRYSVGLIWGVYGLGVYSFLMIPYQGMILASSMLFGILGPKIVTLLVNNDGKVLFNKWIYKVIAFFLIVGSLTAPIFGYFATFLVDKFYPDYAIMETGYILSIIYFSAIIVAAISFFDWYFIGISKEKFVSISSTVSVSVMVLAFPYFYYFDGEIHQFASVIMISRFASLLVCILVYRREYIHS